MSDKARALKERTLKIEAEHAQRMGGTFRDAETANMRLLERLEARKRLRKIAAAGPAQKPKRKETPGITKKELAGENVTRKPAAPIVQAAPSCKYCGTCRWCKRFQRTALIMRKAREGDKVAQGLAYELVGIALAANERSDYRDVMGVEYPFSRIRGQTAIRAVNAGIEAVCDRSVRLLGAWA